MKTNSRTSVQELHKQKRLTQWFILTLIFNIFLQIDFVESFFSSTHESQQVVQLKEVCGSLSKMGERPSDNGIIQFASSFGISTSNTFQLEFVVQENKQGSFSAGLKIAAIQSENSFFAKLFAFKFSGLSPPLV